MAMRDPGTPGRNPFFDHRSDAELGDPTGPEEDLGAEERAADPFADGTRPPGFGRVARGRPARTRSARSPRSSTPSRAPSPRRPSTSSPPRTSWCSR